MKREFFQFIAFRILLGVLLFPAQAFAAPAAPFALTHAPDFITENSARLNGKVTTNDTQDTEYWFEWSFSGRSEIYNTQKIRIWGGSDVNATLVGLHPETSYTYRIVAENSRGIDRGQTTYFTTKKLTVNTDPEIRVATLDPNSITDTSAKLRAYVSPHGSTQMTYWFQWGTDATLPYSSYRATVGGASGAVEYIISPLNPGTTYFFRVMGENTQGKQYGAVKYFTTTGVKPSPVYSGGTSSNVPGENFQEEVVDRINEIDPIVTHQSVSVSYSWNVPSNNPSLLIYYGTTTDLNILWTYGPIAKKGEYHAAIPFHPSGDRIYYQATIIQGTKKTIGTVKMAERMRTLPAVSSQTNVQSGSIVPQVPSTSGQSTSGTVALPGQAIPNPLVMLFGNKKPTDATSTIQGQQTASVAGAGGFFSLFQRQKTTTSPTVDLLTSSEGERKAHSTMEYTIRYANNTAAPITSAVLKVIFPKNVIYIGDNTSNEFMVEEPSGSGERVYVLSVGNLNPKEGRTITMLGMLTNDTTLAGVRARLFYSANGVEKTLASRAVTHEDIVQHEKGEAIGANENPALASESEDKNKTWSLFPTTLLGWVFLVLLIVLGVVGYHKGKEYYRQKKAQYEEEEKKWRQKSA